MVAPCVGTTAFAFKTCIILIDLCHSFSTDAGTSKKVFDSLIKSTSSSVLSNAAIVLVTHAAHFLNRVDNILVVVDGEARFLGTWSELSGFRPEDGKTREAVDFIQASVQDAACHEAENAAEGLGENGVALKEKDGDEMEAKGKLMKIEEREHGLSSIRTWMLWFKHAGGLPFLLTQVAFMTVDRFAYVASEYWLARWTSGAYDAIDVFGIHFNAQTDGISAQFQFLKVYAIIISVSVIFTFFR